MLNECAHREHECGRGYQSQQQDIINKVDDEALVDHGKDGYCNSPTAYTPSLIYEMQKKTIKKFVNGKFLFRRYEKC